MFTSEEEDKKETADESFWAASFVLPVWRDWKAKINVDFKWDGIKETKAAATAADATADAAISTKLNSPTFESDSISSKPFQGLN